MLGSQVRGSYASTNIHLLYVRVPGKGIVMHRCLWDDDDTGEIGIDYVLGGNRCGWFYGILNGSWKWKMKQWKLEMKDETMEVGNERWNILVVE